MFYVTYIVSWILGNELVGRLSCGITIYITIFIFENKVNDNFFCKYKKIGLCLVFFIVLFEIVLSYLGTYNLLFYKIIEKLQTTASPFMYFLALCIFYCFKEWKLKQNNIINFIGKYASGAYLLHGGAGFIKDYLWDDLFKVGEYYVKSIDVYTLHYIYCILSLFFIGVLCEWLYSLTLGKIFDGILKRILLRFSKEQE